jgi:diguanylate cyclase (GGDEF)-like protein
VRTRRVAIAAVALTIAATLSLSFALVVRDGHRTMLAQVEAGERLIAGERAAVLAQAFHDARGNVGGSSSLVVRPDEDRHDATVHISNGAAEQVISIGRLSPEFLRPLPDFPGTVSLVSRLGVVLVTSSVKTSPQVQSPEVLMALAHGRPAAIRYHSPLLDTDRIGMVAPVPGTRLMVVVGADAALARDPADALARRFLMVLLLTTAVVGMLTTLLVALVLAGRRQLVAERDDAAVLARTDPLTQAANRRAFDDAVAELSEAATPVGIVAMDLDDLKQVNDALGHDAGDDALRRAAEAMHAAVRPGDVFARTGGDEFVLLLPGATAEQLALVERRIRAAVARSELPRHGQLSVTTGTALVPGLQLPQGLLDADEVLYRSKRRRAGRPVRV